MSKSEIEVYVRTFNSYSHIKEADFVGIKDLSFVDKICKEDLYTNPFECIEREDYILAKYLEQKYSYVKQKESSSSSQYTGRIQEWKDIYLNKSISLEEKSFIADCILKYFKYFHGKSNDSLHKKFQTIIETNSVTNIKEIPTGYYLDIFRIEIIYAYTKDKTNFYFDANLTNLIDKKDMPEYLSKKFLSSKNGIYKYEYKRAFLRSEYYKNGDIWNPVDIENLKPKRTVYKKASFKTISIPANQPIYFMLSEVEPSPVRIEGIRKRLEIGDDKISSLISKIYLNNLFFCIDETYFSKENTNNYYIHANDSSISNYSCNRLVQIPALGEDYNINNSKKYFEVTNVSFFKKESAPTVLVPDYGGYANFLYKELNSSYEKYIKETGRSINLSANENYEQLLENLTEIICNRNNKWEVLLNKINVSRLKKDYYNTYVLCQKILRLSEKLSWWISSNEYLDYLNDYKYYYLYQNNNEKDFNNIISDKFVKYLKLLNGINFENKAFTYLYKNLKTIVYSNYKVHNKKLFNIDINMTMDEFFNSYFFCENKKIKIDNNFEFNKITEINDRNFLFELFYPHVKNSGDIFFDILECLTPAIFCHEGKKVSNTKGLALLYKSLFQNLRPNSSFHISVIPLSEKARNLNFYKKQNTIYVLTVNKKKEYTKLKDYAEDIKKGKYITSIKGVLGVFGICASLYTIATTEDEDVRCNTLCSMTGTIINLININNILDDSLKYGNFTKVTNIACITSAINCIGYVYSFFNFGDREYYSINFAFEALLLVLALPVFNISAITILILVTLKILLIDPIINYYFKTDDYEKWVKCNQFGKIVNLNGNGDWKYLYNKYVDHQYNDNKYLLLSKKEKFEEISFSWRNSKIAQINTYYNILYDFTCNCSLLNKLEYNSQKSKGRNIIYNSIWNAVKIEILIKEFYDDDCFVIEFYSNTSMKLIKVRIDENNSNIKFIKGKGYTIILYIVNKDVHDSINKIKTIKSENQLFYRDFYGNTNVIINDDLKIIYNNELLNTSTLNELSKFNIKYFCSISTSYGETNPLVTKTYNAITRENVY